MLGTMELENLLDIMVYTIDVQRWVKKPVTLLKNPNKHSNKKGQGRKILSLKSWRTNLCHGFQRIMKRSASMFYASYSLESSFFDQEKYSSWF